MLSHCIVSVSLRADGFAGGNGEQIVMAIPELDLVIAFYGGNYSDSAPIFTLQRVYVPQYILPAVDN